ncbi:putative biotin synthesis protein, BioC [Taylorella equigenitalis 14/56]|uniref:Biotin synthesis protein bioC n=2 Tax=Taylorella equigenitalis TaxID=29575 RepID=A0A654KHG3_TAYEM|nr:methyltransferase domain-containing protein [Taylorella equigenitalis]ADU91825.1 Biotin synthesis protein bioC [Taylorella equigenitalis MCE9]WDU56604.1 methyltransferase domain-containing protein [Taylorella equigenitalis]CCG18281.1 putative biotin synthesis protein, BioC [Taylorella equigenitalis 14/56]
MNTIDKSRIRSKFAKSIATYDGQALAQKMINARLIEILTKYGRTNFHNVLELGCGTGDLSERLVNSCYADEWVFNDLVPECEEILRSKLPSLDFNFICSDSEYLAINKSFDLIASASTVQWFSDLKGFLNKINDHLNDQGLLLISTFLPDNLIEIQNLTSLSLNYFKAEYILNALKTNFEILYYEPLKVQLQFSSGRCMLTHLRDTGVNGISKNAFSLTETRKFLSDYEEASALPNGNYALTYSAFLFLSKKI